MGVMDMGVMVMGARASTARLHVLVYSNMRPWHESMCTCM